MSAARLPPRQIRLLERPVFGVLGTVGRNDTVQTSPMWFELDGDRVLFTHTSTRTKYRNLQRNPSMSFTVYDPDHPYDYVEVRGRLVEAQPDPTGGFYQQLSRRYGSENPSTPPDAADRVILVMSIDKVIGR